ncbi:type II toxin-antitoxin system VapB family antitoxin [Membranicola marinus]|uniref:Type II toxin-antitoxin system VapB family antitoxin n=1 Tax=Membranihabitans marinus TaxID=1227546 RepID=A0A953HTE6_9BACT|nr:type II toxin-antitoxin system VapB family antitoxin [Membranihabitans marinus]MBY5958085.1 type II toxin-antitoxin system VapB family antitoxin [Membranihabitans marinus]
MRTNIDIDDDLLNEILKKTNYKTKKAAVNAALEEYVRKLKLKELANLKGKVKWEGDLDAMRSV